MLSLLVLMGSIEVGVGVHVTHLEAENANDGFLNNRLISVMYENTRLTVFKNSYYTNSAALTRNIELGKGFSLDLGLVYGYTEGQIHRKLFITDNTAFIGALNYEVYRSGNFKINTSLFGEAVVTSFSYSFN
jgi:hypothetical protein